MVGDAELAVAAAGGDRDALADIYDRYANTLFEICRVILGDAHEAADALHDAFVIAATRLQGLRDPERLKPWLCAIARHEAIRRSSRRARTRPVRDEILDIPVTDDAARGLIADDAAALVWESAESLTERERAVLVLNVRQGLDGADLAAAAGLPGDTTSVVLSRAKTQLAAAVRCTLLVRRGRQDCAELAKIVPRKHAAIDALTRKRVTRHAADCATCSPKWHATPDALGVLAAAPIIGAPVGLRHKVLNDPRLISFSAPLGAGQWKEDGFPPDQDRERRKRPVAAMLAAAAVALVVAAGLLSAGSDDDRDLAAPRRGTTIVEEEPFEPWPTSPPGETTTTTIRRATTTTSVRRPTTTTTRRPGVAPATTAPAPPPPTTTTAPGTLTINASARDASIPCGATTTVVATTSGRPVQAGEGLFLNWRDATGSGGAKNMSNNGSSWSAALGPFDAPGTVTWWVSTNRGARSSNHTIDVTRPC